MIRRIGEFFGTMTVGAIFTSSLRGYETKTYRVEKVNSKSVILSREDGAQRPHQYVRKVLV